MPSSRLVADVPAGLTPHAALAGDDQHVALLLHLHLDLLLGDARGEPRAEHVRLRRLPALDVRVGEGGGVAGQPRVRPRRRAEDAAEAEGVLPCVQGQRVDEPRHQRHLIRSERARLFNGGSFLCLNEMVLGGNGAEAPAGYIWTS